MEWEWIYGISVGVLIVYGIYREVKKHGFN